MTRKLILIFLFIMYVGIPASAQLSLFYNNRAIPIGQNSFLVFGDSSNDHSLSRYKEIQQDLKPYWQNRSSFSFKNEMFWIRLNLQEIPGAEGARYLVIRNPHINFLQLWLFQKDSLVREYPLTGDHLPFSTRQMDHTDYVFSLPQNFNLKSGSLLIMADKRNEQLAVPVHFFSENGFIKYSSGKNMLAGLIVGISLFLFIFNLFLFWQIRERVFVFYGLYILMIVLYIISDFGYAFAYFFPLHPAPADYMRPVTISLATPLYVLFCSELLNLKKNHVSPYRFMRWLLAAFFIFLVLIILGGRQLGGIILWQRLMQPFLTLLAVANLVVGLIALKKGTAYSRFVVATTLILWLSTGLYAFYISGALPDNLFTQNLLNLGFVADICILAFALSIRFKNYKQQSEELLRKTQVQEEQIFKSVTDYQEKELQRLSSLLHDSIGARLSALRLNLEDGAGEQGNPKIDRAISGISELANEVRSFSHSLSPILLQQKGVEKALQEYVDSVNQSGKLFIQFESIGSQNTTSYRYELLIYNITHELIQNIIKHSDASEAIVQIILEDGVVSIFAEDNGTGFDINSIKEGLGFSQIRQLVTFVNGRLDIRSAEKNGTRISIEFLTLPDATHTDINRR